LEINKLLLLHLVGSSILLYLHWWCTVKHKSSLKSGVGLFRTVGPCLSTSPVLRNTQVSAAVLHLTEVGAKLEAGILW